MARQSRTTTSDPMGRIVDLGLPGVQLPSPLALDSSVLIPQFLTAFHTPHPRVALRAAQLFALLQSSGAVGIITSTVANEFFHFAITATYKAEIPNHHANLVAHFGRRRGFDWKDLYKIDGTILQRLDSDLERLRRFVRGNGLVFLQPDDLMPVASGRPLDEELVHLVGLYGLDTSDTAVLVEAQRAGVSSIATLDQDMHRAVADFDVYTWL